jgi:hypothetical protein
VLPTGEAEPVRPDSMAALRYRDVSAVRRRIEQARDATAAYLEGLDRA